MWIRVHCILNWPFAKFRTCGLPCGFLMSFYSDVTIAQLFYGPFDCDVIRPYQFFSLLSVSGRVGFGGPYWQKTNKWIWTKSGKFMSVIFNAKAYSISVAEALALMVSLVHIWKLWINLEHLTDFDDVITINWILMQRKGTIESSYYRGGSVLTKGGMHDMSRVQ